MIIQWPLRMTDSFSETVNSSFTIATRYVAVACHPKKASHQI